jgi:hypothetical protein
MVRYFQVILVDNEKKNNKATYHDLISNEPARAVRTAMARYAKEGHPTFELNAETQELWTNSAGDLVQTNKCYKITRSKLSTPRLRVKGNKQQGVFKFDTVVKALKLQTKTVILKKNTTGGVILGGETSSKKKKKQQTTTRKKNTKKKISASAKKNTSKKKISASSSKKKISEKKIYNKKISEKKISTSSANKKISTASEKKRQGVGTTKKKNSYISRSSSCDSPKLKKKKKEDFTPTERMADKQAQMIQLFTRLLLDEE